MIRFQPIKTSDVAAYHYMEKLLTDSFPEEEYRDLKELQKYTDTVAHFYNNIIYDNEKQIGIITYWDFDSFYYVEHFAIDPAQRNGGYGQKVLEHLKHQVNLPIVLEVELPTEEIARRRINFYQKNAYELWEKEYFQPPYKAGHDFLPMFLMVNGSLNMDKDFCEVKKRIHRDVYGVK